LTKHKVYIDGTDLTDFTVQEHFTLDEIETGKKKGNPVRITGTIPEDAIVTLVGGQKGGIRSNSAGKINGTVMIKLDESAFTTVPLASEKVSINPTKKLIVIKSDDGSSQARFEITITPVVQLLDDPERDNPPPSNGGDGDHNRGPENNNNNNNGGLGNEGDNHAGEKKGD
jgi:hypothetical protein